MRARFAAVLVLVDVALVPVIFVLTSAFMPLGRLGHRSAAGVQPFGTPALLLAALLVALVGTSGGYAATAGVAPSGIRLAAAVAVGSWVVWVIATALARAPDLGQYVVATFLLTAALILARAVVGALPRRPERVLIVGGGSVARMLVDLLSRQDGDRVHVVGRLDDDPVEDTSTLTRLGRLEDLRATVEEQGVDRVIVSFSRRTDAEVMDILRQADGLGLEVDIVPRLFDLVGRRPLTRPLGGLALVHVPSPRDSVPQRVAKRTLDLLLSSALIVLTTPLLLAAALAVLVEDGRPVIYRQSRIGRDGRPFRILKFRTMVHDADRVALARVEQLETGTVSIEETARILKAADARLTRVGRLLRRTSIDELPQLWNVVIGEMSLVGPRPLRPFEAAALSDWQIRRQRVRPGMTGLWQVLGRSTIGWDERIQLDYTYVRHWSLASDLRILARTVPVVLGRRGAM